MSKRGTYIAQYVFVRKYAHKIPVISLKCLLSSTTLTLFNLIYWIFEMSSSVISSTGRPKPSEYSYRH